MVQVELRDRTSILPSFNAWNRASAESGTGLTRFGSPKIAAATARQKSTSKPDHWPRSLTYENPGRPSLTPHMSAPRALTAASVCGEAPDAASAKTAAATIAMKDRRRPRPDVPRTEPIRTPADDL